MTKIHVENIIWNAPTEVKLPTDINIDITEQNQYLLEDIDESTDHLSDYLFDIYGYRYCSLVVGYE